MKRTMLTAVAALLLLTGCAGAPSFNTMAGLKEAFEEAGGYCPYDTERDPSWFIADAQYMTICTYDGDRKALLLVFRNNSDLTYYLESLDDNIHLEHGDQWSIAPLGGSIDHMPTVGGKRI